MQVYPDKLDAQLRRGLAPAYLVAGDEPLLQRDAIDSIRAAAKIAGFDNIERTIEDSSFDWQAWLSGCAEMSLFGEKRFIELRLSSSAIGLEGSNALCDYLANPAPDAVLLVSAPRVNGKPKWVGQFTGTGIYVPVYPLEPDQLPKWLANRATRHRLRLQQDAAQLLAERIEGNLVAAEQELEKLALRFVDKDASQAISIGIEQVASSVGDSARFSAFDMFDHALAAQPRAAARALAHLKSEGSEPVELLGPVGYELRKLAALLEYKARNQLAAGIRSAGGAAKKRALYQRALPRIQAHDIERCTILAARADLLGKSGQRSSAFHAIEMLLLRVAGTPLPVEDVLLNT
ncbi:MAG: DNA polymerase III subunit delta [Pseudomonadales bacterium]